MADLIAPFAGDAAQQVAERLLARFGSLQRALDAAAEIDDPADVDAGVLGQLRAAGQLVKAAGRERIARIPVSSADPQLHGYLRQILGAAPHEALHAIFLDRQGRYLTDEGLAQGTTARITMATRQLVARALNLGAAGVILAHNHPSGDPQPSAEDRAATEAIRQLAAAIDVQLLDHLIITRTRVFSFAAGGLL